MNIQNMTVHGEKVQQHIRSAIKLCAYRWFEAQAESHRLAICGMYAEAAAYHDRADRWFARMERYGRLASAAMH